MTHPPFFPPWNMDIPNEHSHQLKILFPVFILDVGGSGIHIWENTSYTKWVK